MKSHRYASLACLALAALASSPAHAWYTKTSFAPTSLKTACLKPTLAQCKDPAYFETKCGAAELSAHLSDPSWVCFGVYSSSHSAFTSQPAVAVKKTLVPETTTQGGIESTQYLESAVTSVEAEDKSTHFAGKPYGCFASQYGATPTKLGSEKVGLWETYQLDPCIEAAPDAPSSAWDWNGLAVASCAEYAFEKFYDFGRVEQASAASEHDARKVFELLTSPSSPVRMTGQTAVRSRSGKTSSPLPFAACAPGNSFTSYLSPPQPGSCAPESWSWHLQKAQALAAAGYSDEALEYLARKEADFDELVAAKYMVQTQQALNGGAIGSSNPMVSQQAMLESYALNAQIVWWDGQIDAALAIAQSELGCVPSVAGVLTPCDWAPSDLRDTLYTHYRNLRSAARAKCEAVTGGDLTNLTSRFVDVYGSPLGHAMSPYTGKPLPVIAYTASTESLDTYFSQLEMHRQWLAAELAKLKKQLPVDATGRVTTSQVRADEESMGGDMFGAAYRYASMWAVSDPTPKANVCDATVLAETTVESRAAIVGFDQELFYGHAKLTPSNVSAEVRVLGMSLATVNEPIPAGTYDIVSAHPSWDKKQTLFDAIFPVFGIPVGISAGVAGHVGMDVDVRATVGAPISYAQGCSAKLAIDGLVTPKAGVDGFATVGIDLLIVRAGIKGALTLLDLELPLDVDLSLTFKAGANGSVDYLVSAAASLDLVVETLSGRLSLFAELNLLFTSLSEEITIVEWTGFRTVQNLMDMHYSTVAPLTVINDFNK